MGKLKTIFLVLMGIACLVSAGCTQSSGNSTATPAVPRENVIPPEPATPVPASVATSAPSEVVTIIRYVYPLKDLKDSYLLFMLQVPAEWNVSTYRMMNADTSDYRTDLVANNVFSVHTYLGSRSREQEYRDQFRRLFPAPNETTVTINDIRYDRFEGRAGGNTTVAYIARTTSQNERSYASVLVFTARECNPFEMEDFEKVVSSFRYFSVKSAGTRHGEEIPLYDLEGNAIARNVSPLFFNSTLWEEAGSYSSDDSSSGGSSSGGGSSEGGSSGGGGGGCGGEG